MSLRQALPEPTVADVLAELRLLRADLAAMCAAATPEPPEQLSVAEAAALALRSERTIRAWCEQYRIGTRIRGRWVVYRASLRRHMAARYGEDRLPPGLR